MIVDCTTCIVRGDACTGCIVTLLFDTEPGADVPWHGSGRPDLLRPVPLEFSRRQPDDVDRAIAVFAAAGMLAEQDRPLAYALVEQHPAQHRVGA